MVIRDLTLRSAASFGSFHLIRLLYDEYMFYLVEHRVAMATGETSIAVMGEFLNLSQRSKEEDDASIPSPGSGSLHVGITASVTGSKSNHLPIVQLDGSTSIKRPKLSWCVKCCLPSITFKMFDQHFVPYLCHSYLGSFSSTHHFPIFLRVLPENVKMSQSSSMSIVITFFDSTGPRLVNVQLVSHCECRWFLVSLFLLTCL